MNDLASFKDVRLVLFDLDGTLLRIHPRAVDAFIAFSADLGLAVDADMRRAAIRWDHEQWANNRAVMTSDERNLGQDQFIKRHLGIFLDSLGMSDTAGETFVSQIVERFRDDYSPEANLEPGVVELLQHLRDAGHKLGVVSNRDESLTQVVTELEIIDYLDFTVSGGQVQSWKPDSAIFHHALALGGDVAPQQAVHVGDNYYADVVGARRVGISPILIDADGAFPEAKEECLVFQSIREVGQAFSTN